MRSTHVHAHVLSTRAQHTCTAHVHKGFIRVDASRESGGAGEGLPGAAGAGGGGCRVALVGTSPGKTLSSGDHAGVWRLAGTSGANRVGSVEALLPPTGRPPATPAPRVVKEPCAVKVGFKATRRSGMTSGDSTIGCCRRRGDACVHTKTSGDSVEPPGQVPVGGPLAAQADTRLPETTARWAPWVPPHCRGSRWAGAARPGPHGVPSSDNVRSRLSHPRPPTLGSSASELFTEVAVSLWLSSSSTFLSRKRKDWA
jgi:hypothetical protein